MTVFERAASVESVGSGLALAPNGLRALDVLGLGDEVRKHAIAQAMGMRRPDGRWLLRARSATMLSDRFGDPIILLPRSALINVLLTRIPDGVLELSTAVASVSSSGQVITAAGELRPDLVVAADGVASSVRAALWPGGPALRYAGFTTWRLLVAGAGDTPAMAETWGRGAVFGVMPLADGRVYCYAAAPAEPGERARETAVRLAELVRRFGRWHEPIPSLLASATPGDVLRHDVAELAGPLASFHQGRVALLGDAAHPMTPNLGQGACQALEDAVVLAHLMSAAGGGPPPADFSRGARGDCPRSQQSRFGRGGAGRVLGRPDGANAVRRAVVAPRGRDDHVDLPGGGRVPRRPRDRDGQAQSWRGLARP